MVDGNVKKFVVNLSLVPAPSMTIKRIESTDEIRRDLLQWRREVLAWVKSQRNEHLYAVWHGTENNIESMRYDSERIIDKPSRRMFLHVIKKLEMTIQVIKEELEERGYCERVC